NNQSTFSGNFGRPANEHWWTVRLRLSGPVDPHISTWYSALDAAHGDIRNVDKDGQPVPDGQSEFGRPSLSLRGSRSSSTAQFNAKYATGDTLECTTNINPRYIKWIRVSGSRNIRVLITGFPLDPKK